MPYTKHYQTKTTPQTEPIPGRDMVLDDAGGFGFQLSDWDMLDRFLILGAEGGTYYVSERDLTVRNAEATRRCIEEDGSKVVQRIAEIVQGGRAVKPQPALFALALVFKFGDDVAKSQAVVRFRDIVRTGSWLLQFIDYVTAFRGWGRSLKRAVQRWFLESDARWLAYQVLKYQGRYNYRQRDALRLSHPKELDLQKRAILNWVVKGDLGDEAPTAFSTDGAPDEVLGRILIRDELMTLEDTKANAKRVAEEVERYRLTWEMIPRWSQQYPEVWEALVQDMPVMATVRNLATLTRHGVLAPMSAGAQVVVDRLTSEDQISRSRVHPLALLLALNIYSSGRAVLARTRGGEAKTWNPVREVVDALDEAFYLSFDNVEGTGKRIVLGVDFSGSMTFAEMSGMPAMNPAQAAMVMAMVTARTEKTYVTVGFTRRIYELSVSPRERLDDIMRKHPGTGEGTDCAQPILWATANGIEADAFVLYTDMQTWAGHTHPVQALERYRQKTGIAAKLVGVNMTASGQTVVDVKDPLGLEVCGFDTSAPQAISEFIRM